MGDKWTLLIIRDLASGPRRFVELQRTLPGISTEQLRSRLNRMVADDLLTRQRYREVPPRVDYELTERARELAPVIGELARWGYRWTWDEPRKGEAVTIGAIFRAAPGLLRLGDSGGTVDLVVEQDRGADRSYVLTIGPEETTISEQPVEGADATVVGSIAAWIAALGTGADTSGLRITGDDALAAAVLAAFATEAGRAASIAA